MSAPVVVGAVLYDPKVSVIWDIIREFFESHHCPMDVRLFADYDRQNAALMASEIDIAWNSPLAWLDVQRRSGGTCRAIAMRDTDRDRVSHLIVPAASPAASLESLAGQRIAFGAMDSPQARLIPQGMLARAGLEPGRDYQERRHDLLVGLHGDHIGGEKEAFLTMHRGEAEASALIDLNWDAWTRDGTIDPVKYRILATTDHFDHCVFAVRADFDADRERAWLSVLHSMSYEDPRHREMMDLEGLKKWEPGRTSGFGPLADACQHFDYFA